LQKGAGGDMTHGIDQLTEDIFVQYLNKFGKISSEESGMIGEGENLIILDPLDGSDNFLSGFPYYGTSIALENKDGNILAGIVTNLATGKIYIKTKDKFIATNLLTGEMYKIGVHAAPKIGIFERAYRSFESVNKLKYAKIKYRVPGAVALSLALAHEVSFVIMEGKLREFDVKAGLFMCEDLYQHKTNDLTIICHQENIFNQLKQILLED
jgi:myo-inositol-1(or 4)-monophosphatase